MPIYPYNSPQILTDSIYSAYQGQLGMAPAAVRQAAYLIAEMAVSEDVETLLVSTIVTGTHMPNGIKNSFLADYAYINRFVTAREYDYLGNLWNTITDLSDSYLQIRNYELGHIDYAYRFPVYRLEYVLDVGFSSGTAYQPNILLALTKYSNIVINEIMGYGNESVGDIGVKEFSNQSYRESRVALLRTNFGTSATAQFIKKLLNRYHLHRRGARGL